MSSLPYDSRRAPDDWFAAQPPPPTTGAPTAMSVDAARNIANKQQKVEGFAAVPGAPAPGAPTAPTGPGTPTPTGTTGGGGDPVAIIQQAAQGLPPTSASLDPILAALRAQGIPATRATHANNTLASDDAIVLPDGRVIDLITGVHSGNPQWSGFQPSGEIYDPGRSVVGPDGKITNFGSYLTGQGLPVNPGRSAGGAGGGAAGGGMGGYDPGYADRLGYTGDLQMDPGFQFRLQQGQQAIERSAAAKGTLLTGGTLKGLERYAQDYSSNEFQNRYQRLFGEQQNRYNQLYGLASLGQNAAAQTGNANQNFANQGSNLLTDQGNARAAATVAGSNATNTAIQNSTNAAQQLYLARLYGQRPPTSDPYAPGGSKFSGPINQ